MPDGDRSRRSDVAAVSAPGRPPCVCAAAGGARGCGQVRVPIVFEANRCVPADRYFSARKKTARIDDSSGQLVTAISTAVIGVEDPAGTSSEHVWIFSSFENRYLSMVAERDHLRSSGGVRWLFS